MATEKEQPAVETQEQVAQPEPAQTKTPTQEVLEKIQQEAEEAAYKKLQRAQTKLANENLTLKKQLTQLSGRDKILREVIEEVKPELTGEFDKENQYAQWQQQVDDRKAKIESKISTAGFDPEDDRFEVVFDLFETAALSGRFDRVEQKLERILNKAKQTPSPVKKDEKLEEESRRAEMERRGELTSETEVSPARSSRLWSMAEIDKYASEPGGWRTLEKEFGNNFLYEIERRRKAGLIR